MVYQILARKWRPRILDDVIGQSHVLKAIRNSFILKKLHHAYILSGTRGVGKTTIARLFAKILNCKSGLEFELCGICKTCLEIEKGSFLDVIEIDAASRTKIEDTRVFLDDVCYSPHLGEFKIYLIDEVHMLSKNSLNALLKILEEPPKHVKFFLVTTEPKKLPSTVKSRCVQFYLRPLLVSQIVDQLIYILKKENIEFEISAIKLIADFSQGSMRDALNLSEQAIILGKNKVFKDIVREILGIIDTEHALFLLENLITANIHAVMFRISECQMLDVNWDYLLSDMLSLLQKIAIFQISSCKNDYKFDDDTMLKISRLHTLSEKITSKNIQIYYQILLAGREELFYAPSYRMGFEMIMMRVYTLFHVSDPGGEYCSLNKDINKNQNINMDTYIEDVLINQGAFISSYLSGVNFDVINNKRDDTKIVNK